MQHIFNKMVTFPPAFSKLRLLLPGETRFATVFIMLKRFMDVKDALIELCSTMAFKKYIKAQKGEVMSKGQLVLDKVTNTVWWEKLEFFLRIFGPITNSLRLADSDLPCAGKMYMQMYNVQEELKKALETNFLPKTVVEEVSLFFL
jgi:hypothetical protein